MSGFFSFHLATTASMPGTHVQNWSETFPPVGAQAAALVWPPAPAPAPVEPESDPLLLEQAAASMAGATRRAASRTTRRRPRGLDGVTCWAGAGPRREWIIAVSFDTVPGCAGGDGFEQCRPETSNNKQRMSTGQRGVKRSVQGDRIRDGTETRTPCLTCSFTPL